MQIIFELIIWFLMEVIFWGIMFWTGRIIILIITFGKWKLQITRNDDRKKLKKEPKIIATAVIGFLFWVGIGVALIIAI